MNQQELSRVNVNDACQIVDELQYNRVRTTDKMEVTLMQTIELRWARLGFFYHLLHMLACNCWSDIPEPETQKKNGIITIENQEDLA